MNTECIAETVIEAAIRVKLQTLQQAHPIGIRGNRGHDKNIGAGLRPWQHWLGSCIFVLTVCSAIHHLPT